MQKGLCESVNLTIKSRLGKVKSSILELTSLCQDFRMEVVGGVLGAFDIWEICIVPTLLNNCGVWINVDKKCAKLYEDQQNMFLRSLFKLPSSAPIPGMRAITGMLGKK